MKTKTMTVILFIVILVSMTAYAGGQGEAEKKTIIYMGTESSMPAENIAQYNADHPNINLIRVEQDNAKFLADAMAGTAPDIFRIGSGSDIGYYTRRGLLLDLTDHLKDPDGLIDYDDIDMRGCDSMRFDGEEYGKGPWYGLPWDFNNIGMITYNKVMFAKAGIAPLDEDRPITYPEMLELAKRLTQKDSSGNVVTWGYDIFAGWNKFLVSDMAYAAGLSFYADKEKSRMNEDPEMRALWKFMTQFPVQNISMNVNNSVTGGTMAGFRSDRVAITQLGYWFGGVVIGDEDHEKRYGWAPTPILREGADRYTNHLGTTSAGIFSGTKYPDEAYDVFEWIFTGDILLDRAKKGFGIPPFFSLQKHLPTDGDYNRSRTKIALEEANYLVPWQASPLVLESAYDAGWTGNIDSLVNGEITEDEFVDRLYAHMNEALSRGKEELGL